MFFSKLDCVYGVQSNTCSCFIFLKTHYFQNQNELYGQVCLHIRGIC